MKARFILVATLLMAGLAASQAQPTAFTYQGRLNEGASPANGIYDLRFTVHDSISGPGVVAGAMTNSPVNVSNGLFTVALDFGPDVFTGADRWLEIGVRASGDGAFSGLSPRQKLTPTPYAIFAANAQVTTTVKAGGVNSAAIGTGAVGSGAIADGSIVSGDLSSGLLNSTFWRLGGNAGTTVGTHFLGTTDNEPLEVKVNNSRVLRLEPTLGGNPNIIGGAANNVVGVGATSATIAGGKFNGIGQYTLDCVVGGGSGNAIGNDAIRSAIAGGYNNVIGTDASYSTIGGGYNNAIGPNAEYIWLGGGRNNTIRTNSANATLAGGAWNSIGTNTSSCVIGGGTLNEIPANAASATIPGGSQNFATSMAFAAGHRAKANHTGAFVWADSQFPDFASTAANQFLIRAAGGVGIGTTAPDAPLHVQSGAVGVTLNSRAVLGLERVGDTWLQMITTTSNHAGLIFGSPNDSLDASLRYNNLGGRELAFRTLQSTRMVILTNGNVGIGNTGPSDRFMVANARCDGSSWINASDRRLKQGFAPVDAQAVLEKVAALPLQQWSYKAQPDQKHLGPMAQDFRAAFGLGADDTSIATVDADGVALAAVQGLNQKLTEELKRQDTENAQLKARLERLEKLLIHRTPTEPQTEISP